MPCDRGREGAIEGEVLLDDDSPEGGGGDGDRDAVSMVREPNRQAEGFAEGLHGA